MNPAARDLLDGFGELALTGLLEEEADLPHALMLVQGEHAALCGREAVLDRRDEDVRAGVITAGLGGTAPKLLLVDPHHRVGDVLQLPPLAVTVT